VDTSCACETCGKHFSTANAYDNHLKSKKHRETAAKQDTCPTAEVQQVSAKNERKMKDVTDSSNQLQRDSEVAGLSGDAEASGGVAENLQLEKDIGTISCWIIMIYLIYIKTELLLFSGSSILTMLCIVLCKFALHRYQKQFEE